MDKRTKKSLTDEALLLRIRKYCALRERSNNEVRKKLMELSVPEDKIPLFVQKLQDEGFLNENRYVSAYARGKFRNKKWGKRKIEMELKKQGIKGEMLEKGLGEIETEDYLQVLDKLLLKKWKSLKDKPVNSSYSDLFSPALQKLVNYALQKGFEYDMVIDRLKKIL